eukprot:symbB.v1.2.025624.t1/scaffold2499.1/size77698/2
MLRSAEAQCAVKMQNSRKLAGLVEVDGTSLRSWRLPGTQMLAYYQLFGAIQRGSRMVNIYSVGVSHARNMGKPPPESFARIFWTAFPKDLDRKDNEGRTSCLISDGAPCYPKLKRELKVLHRFVNVTQCRKKDVLLHPPSCDAAHPETQRLCACRYPLMAAVNVEESVPSIQTPAVSDNFKVEKEIGNKAQSKLAHTAEVAGWKAGKRAEAYHSQIADFSSEDKTTTDISSHPRVLLLLPGDQSSAVNETLRSLRSLRNFDQNRLMISLGCCGAEASGKKPGKFQATTWICLVGVVWYINHHSTTI